MNTKFWILVLLVGLTISTNQTEFPKDQGILVLNPSTFGKAYKKFPNLVVEYYAPWCGICKNFAPQYVQLVKVLKREVIGIELAKVDCEEHKQFCRDQGIDNYPTLIYYDNGVERKFEERATFDNFIAWINKLVNPIETIDSYARLHHRRKKNDHSVVVVAPQDSHYAQMFKEFSVENPHFKWFHFIDPSSKVLSLNPPRVLIKNSEVENFEIPLEGLKDEEQIKHKIDIHRYPKLKRYEDPAIANMIFERNKPVILYIADTNQTYQKDAALLKQLNEQTLEYAPVVIFIRDNVGSQAERFLSYFGVKTFPFVLYMKQIRMGEMNKYYFRGNLELNELIKFVDDAAAGKLKQDYKSDPIPAKNDGPVIELVGSNYRDVVTPENDVIVTYYMQNCDICDEFVPTFTQVAEEYKKTGSKLIFARINSKDNDCGLNLIGFPTIKLHKSGADLKVVDFTDKERTKNQLLAFLSREGYALPSPKKEEPAQTVTTQKTENTEEKAKATTQTETGASSSAKAEITAQQKETKEEPKVETTAKTSTSSSSKASQEKPKQAKTEAKVEATSTYSQASAKSAEKEAKASSDSDAATKSTTSSEPKAAKEQSKQVKPETVTETKGETEASASTTEKKHSATKTA